MHAMNKLLSDINNEVIAIRKRMRRFEETGDIKRLLRLRDRLDLLQQDLEIVKEMEAARLAPMFRKSYSFESWCDLLAS